MRIHKYPILTDGANLTPFTIDMPVGATILSFQTKDNEPYIWASFDNSNSSTEKRSFKVIGTGIDFDNRPHDRYIDSVQCGIFVWHLYETTD